MTWLIRLTREEWDALQPDEVFVWLRGRCRDTGELEAWWRAHVELLQRWLTDPPAARRRA